jgi:cytochrome c biogenesis protein
VNALRALYTFLRSIKLAVVLLILIAALSALSTLVVQGEEMEYYAQNYAPLLARLIVGLHFQNFFRSVLFLLPAGVFFVNLSVCTIDRMIRRTRSGAPRRLGPDLIHAGILILMIGGIISLIWKVEGYIYLSKGEYAELPDGYRLFLDSFEYTTYDDGRPRDYVSSVEVRQHDEKPMNFDIRVNKPLKIGKLRIYQDSYSSTSTVILTDETGESYPLSPGEGFRVGDRFYFLMGVQPGAAAAPADGEDEGRDPARSLRTATLIFEELDGAGAPVGRHQVGMSGRIDRFRIDDILTTDMTGLRVVQDRGFIPVLIGFIIIGIGLALTFIQKLREENI